MLLKALTVTNSQGSVLDLPVDDPSSVFKVNKIEGLDPVKATLVSSSFANMDGEQYHSSRREARNIKVSLGLRPDYTSMDAKGLRDILYPYFMPKTESLLTFHMFDRFATDFLLQALNLDIYGRVETFDAALFTKEPTVDISLMCFNPDFYDPNKVTFNGMTVADLTDTILSYDGSVDTGVVFTLRPDRDVDEFTIFHRPSDQTLKTIDFAAPLVAGDVLAISSVFGSKSVVLTHAGVELSLLYGLSPQAAWLNLQPGDNSIRVYANGAPVPFTIEYTNKYGGL